MYVIKIIIVGWIAFSMLGFSGSLAPEHICTSAKDIEEAFQKSTCMPIGYFRTLTWIVQQTELKDMCTVLNELLNCVAGSIYGCRELENIEPCVLHMRRALRNKHVDSMFATLPFTWKSCDRVWCKIRREYTDEQFKCIVNCLKRPVFNIIGVFFAFICLVLIQINAVGLISTYNCKTYMVCAIVFVLMAQNSLNEIVLYLIPEATKASAAHYCKCC